MNVGAFVPTFFYIVFLKRKPQGIVYCDFMQHLFNILEVAHN